VKWPRWLQSAAPRLCWEAWLPSYRISRATDALVLEDAERLIAGWNERQEKRMQMLYSPTIGAAILARYWFLWVRCPACRTINAIDLRTLDRHHDAVVGAILPLMPAKRSLRRARVADQHRR